MSLGTIIDLITLGNYIAKKYEITVKKNISDEESEIELLLIDIHDKEVTFNSIVDHPEWVNCLDCNLHSLLSIL